MLRTIAGENYLLLEGFLNPFDQFLLPNISHLADILSVVALQLEVFPSFEVFSWICFQQGSIIWFLGWDAAKDWGRTGKERFFNRQASCTLATGKINKSVHSVLHISNYYIVHIRFYIDNINTFVRMQLALFLAYPSMNAVRELRFDVFLFWCIFKLSDARRFISELGWDGFLRPCPVGVGAASVTLRASYCPWGQLGNWWKHMETWSSILVKQMFHHTSTGSTLLAILQMQENLCQGPPSDMYFRWKIHRRPPPSVAYRTCTSSVEKEKDHMCIEPASLP